MASGRRFCVRVLSGAFGGSVVPIYGRLEIGRAGSADVQVVAPGVSRSHAVILVRPAGHVLVDLLSTNGTWVRGKRIQEHELAIGDVFRVGDCELAYEVLDAELAVASEVVAEQSLRTRRPTERVDLEIIADSARRIRAQSRVPATITGPDGQPYGGNLVADIVVYRNLRLKEMRDGAVPDDMKARFDELDAALRKPRDYGLERGPFIRFTLDEPGALLWEADPKRVDEIRVRELSADGATVTAPDEPVEIDSAGWLSLPAFSGDGSRRVLLSNRAVWNRSGELGLVFTGTLASPADKKRPLSRVRSKTIFID